MTLEELQVRFTADISPLSERLSALQGLLSASGAQADALVSRFQSAGAGAGDGLASGISSRRGAVVAAAQAVAAAAASALRSALAIHSPSKVTMDSGSRFTEGFSKGIAGGVAQVRRAAEKLNVSANSGIAPLETPRGLTQMIKPTQTGGTAASPLENINLTIPLHIDGYQLGVAAINGINRVSRSTGGVELTL